MCVCVCVSVYTHTHTHINTHINIYIYMYVFIYIYIYAFIYLCMYVCICVCVCACVCVCVCIQVYVCMLVCLYVCACTRGRCYGCISMLRYWSSRRYSTLRTLVLLAADFSSSVPTPAHQFPVSSVVLVWPVHARGFCHSPRRFLACFYKSIYRHLGNTPPRSTV